MLISSLISILRSLIYNSAYTLVLYSLPHDHFLSVILDQVGRWKLKDTVMSQHNSIKVHTGNIYVIFRNNFKPLKKVYISNKSIELDLNRREGLLLERYLDYP
jgi:hypothetical protein